jgi:GT2 family glycosyltransferase
VQPSMNWPGERMRLMAKRASWLLRGLMRLRPRHWRALPLACTVVLSDVLFRIWRRPPSRSADALDWGQGLSVVIPERGGVDLLGACLQALHTALAAIAEPVEVIVIVNGSARQDYAALAQQYPQVRWRHFDRPLGFTRAVLQGVNLAGYGAIYLLNNDMALAPEALRSAMAWRSARTFAVASEILFPDDGRRREETGWTFMPVVDALPRPYHAELPDSATRSTVWAGAGSALFHAGKLRELLPACLPFDPFYWEDADLGVRAWRQGYQCLVCPQSQALHLHRVTVKRYYAEAEVERIFERNRLLFQLRNPFPRVSLARTLEHIAALDPRSLAELGGWAACTALWQTRWLAFLAPERDLSYDRMTRGIHLQPLHAPPVLMVSPFAVLPPRHGGALRTQRLAQALSAEFPLVLLSDEAELYADRSDSSYQPFAAVHLISGRPELPEALAQDRVARMDNHAHAALRAELQDLVRRYRPRTVLIEHMELAELVQLDLHPRPPLLLNLQDVLLQPDDPGQAQADRHERTLIEAFDARVVCSPEDQALLGDIDSILVSNGCDAALATDYRPSNGRNILFAGPFRAPINWEGIRTFVDHVYPQLLAQIDGLSLTIVGGPGARARCDAEAAFGHPSIRVLESVDSMRELLAEAALTINPQPQLRGSSIKVLEALAAGRVCVSTAAGARGHRQHGFPGLLVCDRLEEFAPVLTELLLDEPRRRSLESPRPDLLARCDWSHCAQPLIEVLRRAARVAAS